MQIAQCGAVETDRTGKELITHGERQFPIAIYHDHLEVIPVDWHWHEELELIYQIDGEGLYIINDQRVLLQKGEGLFINSEVLHSCWDTDLHHSDLCSMVFHARLAGGSVDSVFWLKYLQPLVHNAAFSYFHFKGEEVSLAGKIREVWNLCYEGEEGYEFQVRNLLSELLFDLYKKQSDSQKKPSQKELRNSERIKNMLDFIHTSYQEQIHIRDIADSAMISESECLRCFRDMIHQSPGQYLKHYRISKACELLRNSSLTVRQISECCGFSDESYFVKMFREMKGKTPGEYKK